MSGKLRQVSISLFIIFSALLIALGIFVLASGKIKLPQKKLTTDTDQTLKIPDFPVPPDHENVGSVFVHYFFRGQLQALKTVSGGTEISIESTEASLPALLITPETRLSRISPPFTAESSQPIKIVELTKGLTVDLSAEYDLRQKVWILRDVFVPTDEN